MQFAGLQKTSFIDFPEKIATVLFTPGCNLRCPFCHNWRLVLEPSGPFLSEEHALQILESRRRFVDAVVVTGGEPTLHPDLPQFLKTLREQGFALKLDTNGFFPDVLEKCLPYLEYIAVDVKTSLDRYRLLGANEVNRFLQTIEMVKAGNTAYEFRNTAVPGFVEEHIIPQMGEIVQGAKCFVFQPFVPGDTLDATFNRVKPHTSDTISHFADQMKEYVEKVLIRA
jgi:pyruvate formate lyase activating enzyme